MTIALAGVYGAARGRLETLIAPVSAKIPMGAIADEVVLGTAAFLAGRYMKNPMVKKLSKAVLIVEAARIGDALASGQVKMGVSKTNDSSYIYG